MIIALALLLAAPDAPMPPRTAAAWIDAARAAEARGEMKTAIDATQRAVEAARKAGDNARLARSLDMLADYQSAFDVPAAIAAIRERVALLSATPGFDLAEARGKLVMLSMMIGDPAVGVDDLHAAAAAMDAAAVTRQQREAGVVAWVMTAQNEYSAGRADAVAETMARATAAIARLEALPGEPSFDLAAACNNLADLYIRESDGPRALALSRKAIAALEAVRTSTHPDLVDPLGVAGDAERRFGSLERAGALFRRAVAIADGAQAMQPAVVAHAYQNLARYYAAIGRAELAIPLLRRGGEVLLAGPAATRQAATDMAGQMRLEASQIANGAGDAATSRSESAAALDLARQPGASPALAATAALNDARFALDAGDLAGARARIDEARAIFARTVKPDSPRNGDLITVEARLLSKGGALAEAAALYDRAIAIMTARPATHPVVIAARSEGATAHLVAGQPPRDAVPLARGAADGETRVLVEAATQSGFQPPLAAEAVFNAAIDVAWAAAGTPGR